MDRDSRQLGTRALRIYLSGAGESHRVERMEACRSSRFCRNAFRSSSSRFWLSRPFAHPLKWNYCVSYALILGAGHSMPPDSSWPSFIYRTRMQEGKAAPHGKVAAGENGFVASTTNITSAFRSVEPLLLTSMGTSAPHPASV